MKKRISFRSAITIVALFAAAIVFIVRTFKTIHPAPMRDFERAITFHEQKCFEAAVIKIANGEEIWLQSGKRIVIQGADSPKGKDVIPAIRELERLVLGRNVTVCPCTSSPQDKHGRWRAQVFISDKSVAELLLEKCLVGLFYYAECNSNIADALYLSYLKGWNSGLNRCREKMTIQSKDAKNHIGATAVVEGTITSAKTTSSPFVFSMEGLKIVAFREDIKRLKSAGLTPEGWSAGTNLKIFGQISDYNGPEIILRSAVQVLEIK